MGHEKCSKTLQMLRIRKIVHYLIELKYIQQYHTALKNTLMTKLLRQLREKICKSGVKIIWICNALVKKNM